MSASPPEALITNLPRLEYEAFHSFALLTREKRGLLDRIRQIEGKLLVLQYQLRDLLSAGGWERVGVDGYTIYLRRQLFVRHHDFATAAEVVAALKRNGMAHFVKEQYNVSTLSKHVRELEEKHKDELDSGEIQSVAALLPRDLIAVLNIEPQFTVVALDQSSGKE
jgi:hypothetical protein